MKKPETWVDAKGQVVYVKGSRKNKVDGLVRSEFVCIMESCMISGTVTRPDGKVFYIPFRRVE
jgi:hypothetical protein